MKMGAKFKKVLGTILALTVLTAGSVGVSNVIKDVGVTKAIQSNNKAVQSGQESVRQIDYAGLQVVASGTCGATDNEEGVMWTVYDSNADEDAATTVGDILVVSGAGEMMSRVGNSRYPWNEYISTITTLVIEDGVTNVGDYAFNNFLLLSSVSIGDSVESLGEYAFSNNSALTTVVLPDGMKSIGYRAFINDIGLTSVVIPGSVETVGNEAFSGCKVLADVVLENGVKSIGNSAFSSTIITSIELPASVTNLGTSIFQNCSKLECVKLEKGLTMISNSMFYGCTELKEIEIPDSVEHIGTYSFYRCAKLNAIELPAQLSSLGANVFRECTSLTSITIPESISILPSYAFYGCKMLSNINMPDGLETIGAYAFFGCDAITQIDIPNSVTKIDSHVFELCSQLQSVVIPSAVSSVGGSAFSNCTSLRSVEFQGELISEIGTETFYGCTQLVSFDIPGSVTMLKEGAFQNCKSLTAMVVPDTVTSMEQEIFRGCSNLESVKLSSCITSISNSTFYGCNKLEIIEIPYGVTNVGASAFNACTSLTSIVLPETVTTLGNNCFYQCSKLSYIEVPVGVKTVPSYAFAECTNLTEVKLAEGVTKVDVYAFSKCENLQFIVLPDTVTTINGNVFERCKELKAIELPSALTTLGANVFKECTNLTTVEFHGDLLNKINANTFDGCSSLQAIVIPQQVTSLGDGAFSGCSSLATVNLPDELQSIGNNTFLQCISLEEVVIPGSCTKIGSRAFDGCTSLWKLEIQEGLTSIATKAFSNCTSLWNITLPDTLTTINSESFKYCSSLEKVVIPDSVTVINDSAFSNCSLLKDVVLSKNCKTLAIRVFGECKSLERIVIPQGVTTINQYAFTNCSNLKEVYIPDTATAINPNAFYNGSSERKIYFCSSEMYQANYASLTGAVAPFTITYVKAEDDETEVSTIVAEVYADGKQSYTFGNDDLPDTTGVWMDTSYGINENVVAGAGFTLRNINEDIELREESAVAFTNQPQDIEMIYGESDKQLSVGVTVLKDNMEATYQWQKAAVVDGVVGEYVTIDGATTDSYVIPSEMLPGEYYYRCVVTCKESGTSTMIYSNQAKVLVHKLDSMIQDLLMESWTYGETANTPSYTCASDESAIVIVEYKLQSDKDTSYTTTVPTNPGDYVVRITLQETEIHKASEAIAEFCIEKITVVPVISGVASKTYDGTAVVEEGDISISLPGVLETEEDGVSISADFTYMSTRVGDNVSVVASGLQLSGDYAKNYKLSTTKLITTGSILAKDLTETMVSAIDSCYFTNTACTPEITVKDGDVLLLENRDYTYTYSDNVHVGTGKVRIVGCGNYSDKEIMVGFDIQNIATPEYAFRGTKHESGWYKSDVGVYAEGYTVSDSLEDGYVSTHTIATEGSNQYTLYFKQNDTGYITAAEVIDIKIDWTEPTFDDGYGITIGDDCWSDLRTDITYERGYNEESVSGTIRAYEEFNEVTYYYYVDTSGNILTENQLDALREDGAFTEATNGAFELTGDNQYVVYAYAADAVENRSTYICSDGIIIDTTEPVISNIVKPSKEELTLTDRSADISFTGSENGFYYYMVKTSDEAAPVSIDEFATHQGGIWTALENVVASELSADDTNSIKLEELMANTSYVVYIMAVDGFDNVSETVSSMAFTTTKTMPQFVEKPTITGVYGDKVEDMKLSQPTSTTAGATGSWTITDEDKGDTPLVGTQKAYEVTFTPEGENADQFESVLAKVVPDVEKADIAPNLPETEINISCGTERVGDVELTTDWVWKEATLTLEQAVPIEAVAIYDGLDKGNYKTESITIIVTRAACSMNNTELKNEKEETCKEDGYTGDVHCGECGAMLTEGRVVPKHNNHTWDEGVVTTEPTFTESGVKTYTCSVCETEKYDELPEIGAPVISDIVEPSIENSTLTDRSASITFAGNESGTYYYIVKESGETAPSSIDEFATQQQGVWTALEGVQEDELLEGDINCIEVNGLDAVSSYVVYIMAIDAVGNISEEVTSVAFTTTKTMPQFVEMPTIAGVYGDKVEDMKISQPTSTTAGVSGSWTITDADKGDIPVVGTQKAYEVTFTPEGENAERLQHVVMRVVPVVEKAEIAPNLPDEEISVPYSTTYVGLVALPTDWVWQDTEVAIEVAVPHEAIAVYNGSDKGNYRTESITITITRAVCTHGTVEKKNVKAETCKEDGYTGDDCCTVCGAVVIAGKTIPKHTKHTWDVGTVTKEPTAVEPGQKTYTCSVCQVTKNEAIEASGIPEKGKEIKDSNNQATYKVADSSVSSAEVEYKAPTNKNTETITIPDTVTIDGVTYKVTSIAKNAFKNNKKLKKITIGNYIKTIGDNAFYGCASLKTVKIGKNVTSIGNKAFYNCKKMTSFTIPSKVNKIGKQAFYKCSQLKKITIKTTKLSKKNVKSKAFGKIHSKVTIKVPKSKLKTYKSLLKARGVSSKAKIKK